MSWFGDTTSGEAGFAAPAPPVASGVPPAPSVPSPSAVGKFSIDLANPGKSVEQDLSAGIGLISGMVGGVAGAIGGIGAGGGTIGGAVSNVAGAVGQVAGAVGSVPLPFVPLAGITPAGAQAAHLGDIPGELGNILGLPSKAVQRFAAGQRVQNATDLPDDIQQSLESGTMTVDQAADALVARGQGFTNAPLTNLALTLITDPMNLIGFGLGKAATIAGDASRTVEAARAVGAADEVGAGTRMVAAAYGALTKGLPSAASGFSDRLLGSATSGVFHSLGSAPYREIVDNVKAIDPAAAAAVGDAMGTANANIAMAAFADLYRRSGDAAAKELLDKPEAFAQAVVQRVKDQIKMDPDEYERIVERHMDTVKASIAGMSPDLVRAQSAQRLALVTGLPEADAATALPKVVDAETFATLHALAYGQAIRELDVAKVASAGSETAIRLGADHSIDDLTLISPDTLTDQRARALLDDIAPTPVEGAAPGITKGGRQRRVLSSRPATAPATLDDAIERYTILRDEFAGRAHSVRDVESFLKSLKDTLPSTFELPVTGKHPLTGPLSAFRAKWAALGYDVGFAPADGMKVIHTPDGDLPLMPFLPAVSEKAPISIRNPMGRLVDGMFRGIDQSKVISVARQRLVEAGVKQGLSPRESRDFFGAVLRQAREYNKSVRGLGGNAVYDTILRDTIGPTRFSQFSEGGHSATFLVNYGFRNEARVVGLTQSLTGAIKQATSSLGDNAVARLAEGVYPDIRFGLSPLFYIQNIIETPIMAALRGTMPRLGDPEVKSLLSDLTKTDQTVRDIQEAGVTIGFANERVGEAIADSSLFGRRFAEAAKGLSVRDLKEKARIAQLSNELGDDWRSAVTTVNPAVWKHMEEAYGTTDTRAILRSYLSERIALQEPGSALALARRVIPGATDADMRTVYNAFMWKLGDGMRNSIQTQYFQPRRSWLSRTVNHPYLGLYPASYMWGHVLPEFARALVLRPFGLHVPLVGLEAVRTVEQQITTAMTEDPNDPILSFIRDHPETMFLMNLLLPGDPTDLVANAPAIARHIVTGKTVDIASDTFSHIGILRDATIPGTLVKEYTTKPKAAPPSLSEQLDSAAQQYDQWVLPHVQASLEQTQAKLLQQGQ